MVTDDKYVVKCLLDGMLALYILRIAVLDIAILELIKLLHSMFTVCALASNKWDPSINVSSISSSNPNKIFVLNIKLDITVKLAPVGFPSCV